jgi:hypothetical protein
VKKGRHRRFEEARALKRSTTDELDETILDDDGIRTRSEPCPECDAPPGKPHASWCLHEDDKEDEDEGW